MRLGAAMLIGAATLLSACAEQTGGYAQPMLPAPPILRRVLRAGLSRV